MSVKTIFKTLLGTIVIMIVGSLVIELFNVTISGIQLRQLARMAAKQSCVLFTQETYKEDNGGGAVSVTDILAADGTTYVSGNFYEENQNSSGYSEKVWRKIYSSSNSCYVNFINTSGMDQYRSLRILNNGINSNGGMSVSTLNWDASDSQIQSNIDATLANTYYNELYTPLNLGITYIDQNVTTRIFKWDATQVISQCNTGSIQKDDITGEYYVNFRGFRCYTQNAMITSVTYKVYNLSDSGDRVSFQNDTGMKPSELGIPRGTSDLIKTTVDGQKVYDNVLVTVASIDYSIPITYEGVTPLKKIFEFAWNHQVDGLSTYSGTGTENYNYDTQYLTDTTTSGVTPSTGKLTYTLVR